MPDQSSSPPSSSPFAGLGTDKALLRSTQRATLPPEPATESEDPPAPPRRQRPRPSTVVSKPASAQAEQNASVLASYQDGLAETVEAIRKVVKVTGREVSFVRLSQHEKDQLADIVYMYKRRGRKTTETEINRIAVNFILEDFRANGEASVLARVLEALQA